MFLRKLLQFFFAVFFQALVLGNIVLIERVGMFSPIFHFLKTIMNMNTIISPLSIYRFYK